MHAFSRISNRTSVELDHRPAPTRCRCDKRRGTDAMPGWGLATPGGRLPVLQELSNAAARSGDVTRDLREGLAGEEAEGSRNVPGRLFDARPHLTPSGHTNQRMLPPWRDAGPSDLNEATDPRSTRSSAGTRPREDHLI